MKLLFDRCIPKAFADLFSKYDSTHASELGWGELTNGELVRRADAEGYRVLITVDGNMQYQTSLKGLQLGALIVNVPNNRFETLAACTRDIDAALPRVQPAEYYVLERNR